MIRVSDDGRGLDAERIRAKAVEKGLISAADAERKTPQQIYQLIWLPGLSTAEKVTEVSGRGVGMDIVRSKIEDLNGTVEVESEPGHGTTFTIKLPLTLAILPCLMVEIDGEVFAVPLESVIEVVDVGRCDMSTVQGHPMASAPRPGRFHLETGQSLPLAPRPPNDRRGTTPTRPPWSSSARKASNWAWP